MNGKKASLLGLLGVIFFISSVILGGILLPGYSHISQLISESYAIGTPYGLQLRYLGYLPAGLFMAAFAFYANKAVPKSTMAGTGFAGLGLFYGIATIIVSIFPCDEGCGQEMVAPSFAQLIHNLSGLLTYMIVPICLLILGMASRKWPNARYVSISGIACGITAILFVGIFSSNLHSNSIGVYQRIIEGSVLLWIVLCSFYLGNMHKAK